MDSTQVKVIEPVQLTVPQNLFACQVEPVQLNANGAATYQWINNTEGINNTATGNPTALPNATLTYTVVGYAENNCYTDTATIPVRISIIPVVDAGINQEVARGTAVTLYPTVSGAVNWEWSPVTFFKLC